MVIAIDRLREISLRCQSGQTLDPELAQWLSSSLDAFLSHRVRALDEALGLRSTRGGLSWWMEEAIRTRDAALRALAKEPNLPSSIRAKARVIRELSRKYAASMWRFDKERAEMPAPYAGTLKQHLWTAFRSGAPMPIGERHIRTIIGK
jgi:hypothetical protein